MEEKRINIDVEVIKKSKICGLCHKNATDDEYSLPRTIPDNKKWQNLVIRLRNILMKKQILKNKFDIKKSYIINK